MNAAADCPTTTIDPKTDFIPALTMTYKSAPIVLYFADNTDTFGSRYNNFYFCGQRNHNIREAVTEYIPSWLT